MIIIGLTGGIGMGKSTVANQFARLGAKICSADACVHKLLGKDGGAVDEVRHHFPDAVKSGMVDRKILGQVVFPDKEKLKLLENILHPLVQEMEGEFIKKARRMGAEMVVLDIPLLFETAGENRMDYTVVVSAPALLQRQRVMARKGMTAEKFERILASQMQDLEKRKRADFIIPTGLGKAYSFKMVKQLVQNL